MLNPCPKHVLCPPGTGTESEGFNYSSEHVDVPEFAGVYYPPVSPYGYYTACQGRCVSLVSQQDADLCAQRQAVLCQNNTGKGPDNKPKQTFGNTPQICTEPGTGRLVTVPADVFFADSQAEANAMALAYANRAQKNPVTPPGPTTVPPPTPGDQLIVISPIPRQTPQPTHKPPPPPSSQCKPCDDTSGVTSFSVVFDVPDGGNAQLQYSPRLKCGAWRFWIETNIAAPQSVANFVTATFVASDPAHTFVDSGSLVNCPQMAWVAPCGHGVDCTPQNAGQYGIFPGCCDTNFFDCLYAECQTIAGQHYLVEVSIQFVPGDPSTELAHQFTFKGQWTGPLPTPP